MTGDIVMYLGIDLGGINIKVGLVNDDYEIVAKNSIPTQRTRKAEEIIRDMANLCIKTVLDSGYLMSDVTHIGIGSPGTHDIVNKTIVYSNNIENFVNIQIEKELQKFINLPVNLENDANSAAYGEMLAGSSKGSENSVVITIGTGIGSGVIINKKIYSGFNHAAAEMGHMVIVAGGKKCSCGRKGCFEVYASATALKAQTKRIIRKYPKSIIHKMIGDDNHISARFAFDAAKQGDEAGLLIVSRYINYLGIGLSNVINIFQPELLIIGGGVCNEGDYLLNPIKECIEKNRYSRNIAQTELKIAALGNDAGIIGAAMLWKLDI